MSHCKKQHRYNDRFEDLPVDQGGDGRHKCAGCAFERGWDAGRILQEEVDLDFESLPESQAGTVRHRSPHAAWAEGYLEGVREYYATKKS